MRALAALVVAAAALAARGEEGIPVSLEVGAAKDLCAAGIVTCPVSSFLCDDPKVAIVENGPGGALLRGLSPGTTLCAVGASAGFRRVLRVTVTAPPRGPAGAPSR